MKKRRPTNLITISISNCSPVYIGRGELVFFLGPCVIESRKQIIEDAKFLIDLAKKLNFSLIFKASYDKANRTSRDSYRGLGMDQGLKILGEVKQKYSIPVMTDCHSPEQMDKASKVVDVVQVPAFLCRQTDLLLAAGKTRKPVLIKKGQFLHPEDMHYAARKVISTGNSQVMFCERGTCCGYRDLIVDFRGFDIMAKGGMPVIFDGTHSVQSIGGAGGRSAGTKGAIPSLVRAAVACGIDGLFLECHQEPERALSDSSTMLAHSDLIPVIKDALAIHKLLF